MTRQLSTAALNGALDYIYGTLLGASPKFKIRTGPQPANCAAGDTGTLLWTGVATGTAFAAAASGEKALVVSFSGTTVAAGTAGHYRLTTSGDVVVEQGAITRAFALTTSAATTATNVLTFADASAISDGMQVHAAGVPSGTTVLSHTSTTVNLSSAVTVGSGVEVYFGDIAGEQYVPNTVFSPGVALEIDVLVRTMAGA